jgi:hypothetical protein
LNRTLFLLCVSVQLRSAAKRLFPAHAQRIADAASKTQLMALLSKLRLQEAPDAPEAPEVAHPMTEAPEEAPDVTVGVTECAPEAPEVTVGVTESYEAPEEVAAEVTCDAPEGDEEPASDEESVRHTIYSIVYVSPYDNLRSLCDSSWSYVTLRGPSVTLR